MSSGTDEKRYNPSLVLFVNMTRRNTFDSSFLVDNSSKTRSAFEKKGFGSSVDYCVVSFQTNKNVYCFAMAQRM